MKPIYIVDEVETIVGVASAALLTYLQGIDPGITAVHYQHGHPKEIIETLMQLDKSSTMQFDKYPLVALFQDFPEVHTGQVGFDSEVTLHIVIVNSTKADYKADERYELNFKPILYPIYYELLKQFNFSKRFSTYGVSTISHTKIDRLYWGKEGLYGNDGNIFNDRLDCIEIRDLKLKVNLKNC